MSRISLQNILDVLTSHNIDVSEYQYELKLESYFNYDEDRESYKRFKCNGDYLAYFALLAQGKPTVSVIAKKFDTVTKFAEFVKRHSTLKLLSTYAISNWRDSTESRVISLDNLTQVTSLVTDVTSKVVTPAASVTAGYSDIQANVDVEMDPPVLFTTSIPEVRKYVISTKDMSALNDAIDAYWEYPNILSCIPSNPNVTADILRKLASHPVPAVAKSAAASAIGETSQDAKYTPDIEYGLLSFNARRSDATPEELRHIQTKLKRADTAIWRSLMHNANTPADVVHQYIKLLSSDVDNLSAVEQNLLVAAIRHDNAPVGMIKQLARCNNAVISGNARAALEC